MQWLNVGMDPVVFFVVRITTEDNYFILDVGPHLPSEKETSPDDGMFDFENFWLADIKPNRM